MTTTERAYKKKILTVILSSVLVLTVFIGATLAYLFMQTDTVTNKLTFVNGNEDNMLSGELVEVWDPEDGLDLKPGAVVEKKPHIKNNSSADVSEWTAMQVIYEKLDKDGVTATAMTPDEVTYLLNVISINFDTTNWIKESGVTANANKVRYYYDSEIAKDGKTTDLFTEVTVLASADNDDLEKVAEFAPGGINIRLEGAVVQSYELDFDEAQNELNDLLPNN